MSINLVKLLVDCSAKSANIAKCIRADPDLLKLLTQEKSSEEANPRFVQDFKTLADVLIQETIRHDVSAVFPELKSNILGEESAEFTNSLGESICVAIGSSKTETQSCLEKVLDGNSNAAKILAEEVHRPVAYESEDLGCIPTLPDIDYSKIGIWIDPIGEIVVTYLNWFPIKTYFPDATQEYINGDTVFSEFPGITSSGLDCVTVLIGVYDKETGKPLIGVVNQPFHKKLADHSYASKVFWGVSIGDLRANNIQRSNEAPNVVVFSTSEDSPVLDKIKEQHYGLVFAAGAGYKILSVILNNAKWFLLTKGSTYKWDTCAPHAILNSLGGGIIDLKESLKAKAAAELTYSEGKANSNGIFAYQEEFHVKEIFDLFR